jgi:hypothetical protein
MGVAVSQSNEDLTVSAFSLSFLFYQVYASLGFLLFLGE